MLKMNNPDGFIDPHGGFCKLKSFQTCLIHQANYLLDQQLRRLEKQFLKGGGFTEKFYRARQNARKRP